MTGSNTDKAGSGADVNNLKIDSMVEDQAQKNYMEKYVLSIVLDQLSFETIYTIKFKALKTCLFSSCSSSASTPD